MAAPKILRLGPVALALGLAPACIIVSDDSGSSGASASSSSSGSTTEGGSSTEGSGTSTSGSGTTTTGSGTTTSGSETTTSGSETMGETSGGGCPCGAEEYCDWPTNLCGGRGEEGACEARPDGCDLLYAPVCGCDGAVYGNACAAQSAGVDVNADGGCLAPEGYAACGFRFCDTASEYCRVSVSDVVGVPDGFECVPLPEGCAPATCACLEGELCAELCEEEDGLVVICPGG